MIKKMLYFLPTITLIAISLLQPLYPETKRQIALRVLDGDTIELGNGDMLRLFGIDAPEIGEPFSQEAKLALEEAVLGMITIEKDPSWNKDKYGRFLVYIFSGDKLVNCEMVRLGLAENIAEKESRYYDCFQKAEQEAMEKKIGIWSSS